MPHERTLEDLDCVTIECAFPDWDAYGAEPVDTRAVEWARRFIRALPPDLPAPSVAADPDGEVSLSWESEDKTSVSVSIAPSGRLSYAGLPADGEGSYGTLEFTDSIPEVLLDHLRRLPHPKRQE